jgi:hypothetical protein
MTEHSKSLFTACIRKGVKIYPNWNPVFGARDGAVGRGTALQAGRSWFRIQIVTGIFSLT